MKILFVCSQGMSSAIAANALLKEAEKQEIDIKVNECSTQAYEGEINQGYDIVMVAPQIRHRYELLKKIADEVQIPCILIQPQGYTPLGGAKLLKQALDGVNMKGN